PRRFAFLPRNICRPKSSRRRSNRRAPTRKPDVLLVHARRAYALTLTVARCTRIALAPQGYRDAFARRCRRPGPLHSRLAIRRSDRGGTRLQGPHSDRVHSSIVAPQGV